MDLMCPLWMMFRASGLSTKIQWRTSRIPKRSDKIFVIITTNLYQIDHILTSVKNFFWHLVYCYKLSKISTEDQEKKQKKPTIFPIPDDDSSRSSLLTSQSKLRENWVQLFLFPRISEAEERMGILWSLMKMLPRFSNGTNDMVKHVKLDPDSRQMDDHFCRQFDF